MKQSEKLRAVLKKFEANPVFIGVDLVEANQKGAMDEAPIHVAARIGTTDDIEVLVAHGADVGARGDLGNTALHFAAMKGREEIVRCLLRLGALHTAPNEFGETPLDCATNGDHDAVVKILRTPERA